MLHHPPSVRSQGTGNPGTKSELFSTAVLLSWRAGFYQRITAHAARASANASPGDNHDGSPRVVAFSGKRHFRDLFADTPDAKRLVISYGPQTLRPPGWPFDPDRTLVFVLASPSGASALTNAEREGPYNELARLLEPWRHVPLGESGRGGSKGAED
jgi:hypothetical protein